MPLKNLVLYVFVFVLGFAYNVNIRTANKTEKAEYAMPIDKDIGITIKKVESSLAEVKDNSIAAEVKLKEITITAKDLSIREICLNKTEYEKIVGPLDLIETPTAYLDVEDISVENIGETLKIC